MAELVAELDTVARALSDVDPVSLAENVLADDTDADAVAAAAIVRRGTQLKINYARTWSCYKGGLLHCGTCGTCIERREAFLMAGVVDPTPYVTTPPLPPKPAPGN